MSDTVITVENLGEKHIFCHQKQARHETFMDTLNHMDRGMPQGLRHPLSTNKKNVVHKEFRLRQNIGHTCTSQFHSYRQAKQ